MLEADNTETAASQVNGRCDAGKASANHDSIGLENEGFPLPLRLLCHSHPGMKGPATKRTAAVERHGPDQTHSQL